MESKVEALVNILIDYIEQPDKTMGEQIKKAVKGYEAEVIQQAFCEVTKVNLWNMNNFLNLKS